MGTNAYMLAEYFRRQAEWRALKAAQYPGDERNVQSEHALLSLAGYVEQPDDDHFGDLRPKAAAMLEDQVVRQPNATLTLGGERTRRGVARYGYEGPSLTVGQHNLFLEELAALVLEDAYEHAMDRAGVDLSRLLANFEVEAAKDGIYLDSRYWRRRLDADPSWSEQWVEQSRFADGEGLDMLEETAAKTRR